VVCNMLCGVSVVCVYMLGVACMWHICDVCGNRQTEMHV